MFRGWHLRFLSNFGLRLEGLGTPELPEDWLENSPVNRRKLAMMRCNYMLHWYDWKVRQYTFLNTFLQIIVLIISGLTPILIFWERTQNLRLLQALLVASAGLCSAMMATFNLKEHAVRWADTREALREEFTMFITNIGYYNNENNDNPDLFLSSVHNIVRKERKEWLAQQMSEHDHKHREGLKEYEHTGITGS